MKKKTRKIVALAVVGAMVLALMAPILAYSVFADELTDKIDQNQGKLDETNQNKNDLKNQIGDVEDQQAGVRAEKVAIDKQIITIEGEIEQLEAQIAQKTEEIAAKETQIAEKETQIAQKSEEITQKDELFKKRLRVMYEKGETSYLEVILSSKSFSDMFTRIELVKEMSAHDKKLIEELTNAKNELENLKATLETDKQTLETDKQTLEADKAAMDSQKAELEKKAQERDALMKQLENKKDELEAMEDELEKAANEIRNEIAQLQAEKKRREEETKKPNKVYYTGGQLGWPSDSSTTVTSPFGMRLHPTLHVYKLHTGMDIGAKRGTNVLAAEAGEVIKAGWSNAYGNYVVIDHGNGMSTLYAHNSKLLVGKGEEVKRGQVIAKVGSTGYSTGPHIHIEVIIDGEYQNPKDYLY